MGRRGCDAGTATGPGDDGRTGGVPYGRGRPGDRGGGGPGRLLGRVSPGAGRSGRDPAGEGPLPPGEGVRRRPHPARGAPAHPDGRRHHRTGLDACPRYALGGRGAPRAHRLARAGPLSGLRAVPQPARLRRHPGPARRCGGGPAVQRLEGGASADGPGGPGHRGRRVLGLPGRPGAGRLPRAGRHRRRRGVRPPRPGAGSGTGPQAADRDGRPALLPQPRTLPGGVPGAVGRPPLPRRRPVSPRLRLDLPDGRRPGQRRPRGASPPAARQGGPARHPGPVAGPDPGGLGAARGERGGPGPQRRPAPRFQPPPAVRARAAAGR